MKSIGKMIELCEGLIGTNDITPWENDFLSSVVDQYRKEKNSSSLSAKQVEIVERIYNKHFA